MNISLLIIALMLIFVLYLGINARRGVKMDLEQWSVGGRGFSAILVFVLMAGELYTTFTFLGASGFGYGYGAASLYIIVYTCLAFVMSYWMLPPIWRFAKHHGVLTQSDFFAKAYDSPALGLLVAIVALVATIPYLILQLKGLGIIVELTSQGSLSPSAAIWCGAVAMIVYVTISGMHGCASTAIVKDILVLGICAFLGFYLPYHYYGGLGEMFIRLEEAKPGFMTLSATGKNSTWFISTVVISGLGMYLWPHAFNAVFTSKAEKSFRKNAIVMPLYALVMLFSMFVGYAAVLQIPGLTGGQIDLALLKLSIQTFDPWFVGVIGAAGLLTALVPSSIMLISASMLLTRNLYLVARPKSSDEHLSVVSRIATPVITLVALALTVGGGNNIVSLLIMGFSFVTQLAPATFASLSRHEIANKYGAFAGLTVGMLTVAYTVASGATMATLFPNAPAWFYDINIGIIGLTLNVFTMLVVSAATRRLSRGGSILLAADTAQPT
jgi:SSS family solute:Na+ symporter